jgi:DNA-binding transcriptional LysR family regulator
MKVRPHCVLPSGDFSYIRFAKKEKLMDLLPSLRAFASAAENGSLTRSAAVLGVAQSMLSRQISALEADAGARLFHRTGRGVVVTELGARLLPRARTLLEGTEAFLSDLRDELTSPVGTVTLAVVPAARPLVAQLCARLRRDSPRIRLRAREGYSGQVEEWLATGEADVGVFNRYSRAAVRDAQVLLRSPMVLIGRRGAPVLRQEELAFRRLAGVPLAMPMRPNAMLTLLETTALRLRVELNCAFESGTDALIVDAVDKAGLFAIVPRHVAQRHYGAARFAWTQVTEPALTQTTWMAQTSARPASPAHRTVASLVRQLGPALTQDKALK